MMGNVVHEKQQTDPLEGLPTLPVVPVPAPPPVTPPLPWFRRLVLFAAPVFLTGAAWGTGYAIYPKLRPSTPSPAPAVAEVEAPAPDGVALYAEHCARCHGVRGDGRGVAQLDPPARHFGAERFKLVSTTNMVPTDEDLLRVLRRGIPGTSMPSFATLSEPELQALVGHVRRLTWDNLYAKLRNKALDDGDFDPLDVAERTDKQTQPGKSLEIPPQTAAVSLDTNHGRKVYLQNCAPCHGPEGRGDGPQVKDPNFKNENGTPARPRDLTGGVFKGGREREHLYARIVLGIPGTPMPASSSMPPQDVDALIQYIWSLSPSPATNGTVAAR